jgi:predicted ATPase
VPVIRTPDQRIRVFVSSTLQELAPERAAAREAITRLRLIPVMFETGARPHPPRELYRAYLEQSHIFIGIYWQRYGWVAPDMSISGLEDEFVLSEEKPRLLYMKKPATEREARLQEMLKRIEQEGKASYRYFSTPEELRDLIENDLALLLTERFEAAVAPSTHQQAVPARVPGVSQGVEAPPPLRSSPRTNLPVQRSPLIGRQRELQEVTDLLMREDTGLLTLTGPGGTGKSRLGLQVAADLQDRFPDGVYLIPLAPITEPGMVVPAIARVLGLREAAGVSMLEALQSYVRGKRLLLILDNFEQVVTAAPLVADLMQVSRSLKLLVTSRVPLHLLDERQYPVPPLELPDRAQIGDLQKLSQSAAVQLFIQRTLEVKPDFEVTDQNAAAVVEICYRLDGLPLAIELAAARSRILTPQAMLLRLQNRLRLLTGGGRDAPARQQTLRGTIEWSHDLLDTEERELFRRLSVFQGGCTLETIEAVCNVDDDLSTASVNILDVVQSNRVSVLGRWPSLSPSQSSSDSLTRCGPSGPSARR